MFKGIFGGKKPEKVEQKPVAPPPNAIPQNQIEFEKVIYQVQQQEEKFDKQIEKYTNQIDNLRNDAKELYRAGKKKNAQFKLAEIQSLEKYIINAENQKAVFFKVRIQLQNGQDNKLASETLKNAVTVLKTVQTEDLEDVLDDLSDITQQSKEVASIFEQLANQDQDKDALDEEMAKLEQEIQMEESNKINQQFNMVPTAHVVPQQQNQQQQYNAPQKQQQQQAPQANDAFSAALLDQLSM